MPALFQNNERLVRLLAQDPGPEPRQRTATVVSATTRAEQHHPGLRLAWRLRLRWQPLQCWPESAGRTPTGLGCDLIPQYWVGADLGKRRQQLDNDSDTKIDQALRLHICVCVFTYIICTYLCGPCQSQLICCWHPRHWGYSSCCCVYSAKCCISSYS